MESESPWGCYSGTAAQAPGSESVTGALRGCICGPLSGADGTGAGRGYLGTASDSEQGAVNTLERKFAVTDSMARPYGAQGHGRRDAPLNLNLQPKQASSENLKLVHDRTWLVIQRVGCTSSVLGSSGVPSN